MQFIKDGEVFKVARITGSQDNILGVTFASEEVIVEVKAWEVNKSAKIRSTSKQVLGQVLSGLELVNVTLGSQYFLSKIYFLPSDSASNAVYKLLIQELIKFFHIDKA